jgi:endonuclease YncB( thermonuclease family)
MREAWPFLPTPRLPITHDGLASVVDGDTLVIHGRRIRLQGIDAPEAAQTCTIGERRYPCGAAAALALADRIGEQTVSCATVEIDEYDRDVAFCSVDGEDLNRWMVREGWALAYVAYSTLYVADEVEARRAGKGMWRGTFDKPWDYRRR